MAMQGTDVKPAIPLLLALLKNADEATSESAARALGQLAEHQIETDAILPALIEATHDPRPKIRLQAVIALAGLGRHSRLVVPALVKSLGDSDFEVAMYATRYLGELRSQPDLVIPALVKGLEKRDLRSMRVQMAALARYGPAIAFCGSDAARHHEHTGDRLLQCRRQQYGVADRARSAAEVGALQIASSLQLSS